MKKKIKITIFCNSVNSIRNFRYDLILDLIDKNYDINLIAPDFDIKNSEIFKKLNLSIHNLNFKRTSLNIFNELINIYKTYKIISKIKPNIILNFAIKPTIYGSMVKIFKNKIKIFSMIEGRGYLFLDELNNNLIIKIYRTIFNYFFKFIIRFNEKIILLNDEDKEYFVKRNLSQKNKIIKISGIGVNLEYFKKEKLLDKNNENINFIFVGRLLKSKGILEYIEAAEIIKNKYKNINFYVLGSMDINPNNINKQQLDRYIQEGIVIWKGEVTNIKKYLEIGHVFVLPTYYKEGLPKSILEAMAMSMPIITTKISGCSETVIEDYNGYFTEIKNSENLATKMEKFILNKNLVTLMGHNSRALAVKHFDVKKINKLIIDFIK